MCCIWQKKRFQVTGIDISSKAVDYVKLKAKKASVKTQFRVENFMKQIIQLFSDHFKIKNIEHIASFEGDDITRYFYSVLL